jgi:4-hydroxybenzoate polyprenyltransferase
LSRAVDEPALARGRVPPLVVDLDGSLLLTDTLHEGLLAACRSAPGVLSALLSLGRTGKAAFKREVALHGLLDVSTLPYNVPLLEWLCDQARKRPLVLATAADSRIATAIAAHLGIFSAVLCSDGLVNMDGPRKLEAIRKQVNNGEFDYVGNAAIDLPIWAAAAGAVLVNARPRIARKARLNGNIVAEFRSESRWIAAAWRAMRPYQWVKNVLVFLPAIASHRILDAAIAVPSFLAFIAFCLCASATYIINDLLDLEADRHHQLKRTRPFASGELSIVAGVRLVVLLLVLAGLIATFLPILFACALVGYFLTTSLYSIVLKRIRTLDVGTLAGLYTLRVLAGGAATAILPSFWLLAFGIFLFFSLAALKRVSELITQPPEDERLLKGRGYGAQDAEALTALGCASAVGAIVVLALYIRSPEVLDLYGNPEVLWLICFCVLFWSAHIWVEGRRGNIIEDPIIFTFKDRASQAAVLGTGVVLLFSILWE